MGITISPTRVLRVLGDDELVEQIRNELNPIRNAMRRLDASKRTIAQLARSIQRNALDDPALESLLRDAGSILEEAVKAGELAGDQIDCAETNRASDNHRTPRDRIGELLSMLACGQDSWLALRPVQQLRDDTSDFNNTPAGHSMDQLAPTKNLRTSALWCDSPPRAMTRAKRSRRSDDLAGGQHANGA